MKDTPINPPPEPNVWDIMLENAEIFDVTKIAKHLDYRCKVAITNQLFGLIYPFAEEAVKEKGLFENRIEELLSIFKKENKHTNAPIAEFELDIHTRVKSVHRVKNHNDPEIRFVADLHKETKVIRTKLFATMVPDDTKVPAILFGVRGK